MIGGSISKFIDQLYFGQEIVFSYNGRKYFIQGWRSDDTEQATMVLDDVTELHEGNYLWEYHAAKMSECAEAFLVAPIWNGKDFLQIENDVVWTDW